MVVSSSKDSSPLWGNLHRFLHPLSSSGMHGVGATDVPAYVNNIGDKISPQAAIKLFADDALL